MDNLKKNVMDAPNSATKEGPVAKAIESQTAKLPSDLFLWASVGVMATSLTFKLARKDSVALFIGQWVAPFLLFGIYNKMVKLEGHDSTSNNGSVPKLVD